MKVYVFQGRSDQPEAIELNAEPSLRSIARAVEEFFREVRGQSVWCSWLSVFRVNGEWAARYSR